MIKLKIVVDDSITTSSSGWHTKFNPRLELYVPPTPVVPEEENGIPLIFIIIFIPIVIVSTIIIIGGVIYLVTRNRNKSNNEK